MWLEAEWALQPPLYIDEVGSNPILLSGKVNGPLQIYAIILKDLWSQAYLWLQAIAGTKLVHCMDTVPTLPAIILFHNTSTQATTSAPSLTLYHPKSTKQNKMKTNKNNITLIQRHLCESRLTEGFREGEWEFTS